MWRFPYYYPLPYGAYYPQYAYTPYALHAFSPSYVVGIGDPFAAAQSAARTMEGMLRAADPGAQFGHIQYTDVVAAYQKAGQYGVDAVAPAIEQGGAPGATQALAKKAWDLNSQLHSEIRMWGPMGPGYQEVQQAKNLAWQMLAAYNQAIAAGQQSGARGGQGVARPARAAPSGPLQAAAQNVLAAIRSATQAGQPVRWTREHGQSAYLWKPTADFQRLYNKASGGNLRVDGVFGSETTKALQSVVGTNRVMAASQQAAAGYR
jgi:hypothetical protein